MQTEQMIHFIINFVFFLLFLQNKISWQLQKKSQIERSSYM